MERFFPTKPVWDAEIQDEGDREGRYGGSHSLLHQSLTDPLADIHPPTPEGSPVTSISIIRRPSIYKQQRTKDRITLTPVSTVTRLTNLPGRRLHTIMASQTPTFRSCALSGVLRHHVLCVPNRRRAAQSRRQRHQKRLDSFWLPDPLRCNLG